LHADWLTHTSATTITTTTTTTTGHSGLGNRLEHVLKNGCATRPGELEADQLVEKRRHYDRRRRLN
jgi:hypothetical protein